LVVYTVLSVLPQPLIQAVVVEVVAQLEALMGVVLVELVFAMSIGWNKS
jgi:hypothetical protein